MKQPLLLLFAGLTCLNIGACAATPSRWSVAAPAASPFVMVLGIAQDAGYPQTACRRPCCEAARRDPALRQHVASLAIVDPISHQRWMIDCTPDLCEQLAMLDAVVPPMSDDAHATISQPLLDGILLTHAHVGHYTGLQDLGREVCGADGVPVYAMPRMTAFLKANGPWSQLVDLHNIELRPLEADHSVQLNERITVTPLLVPHRDEFSETVGYRIQGPQRSVLYIPDIDKWERWDRRIEDEIARVDVAYLDGTFFDGEELGGRDMSTIPHPFVRESMNRLAALPASERAKIHFIHLNHTNPLLQTGSAADRQMQRAGFTAARAGRVEPL